MTVEKMKGKISSTKYARLAKQHSRIDFRSGRVVRKCASSQEEKNVERDNAQVVDKPLKVFSFFFQKKTPTILNKAHIYEGTEMALKQYTRAVFLFKTLQNSFIEAN